MSTPVEYVRDRLVAVRAVPDGWMGLCPAHDDRNPSLHVTEGADGRALLHCMAGCAPDDVTKALGIDPRDLFAEPPPPTVHIGRDAWRELAARPVAEYIYTDANGHPVMRVVRMSTVDERGAVAGKTFRQFRADGAGGWLPGLAGVQPPLYRLPEVSAAVAAGRTVWVVEGEKDANRLAQFGEIATCNPMGAGKWRPWHTDVLHGALVAIVADDDPPGHAHALAVREALGGAAPVMLPAPGCKDVSEHLDQGHALAALRPWTGAPPAEPAEPAPGERYAALTVTSAGLDLIPEPVYAVRGILQADSLAWLQGRPGAGKSFVALAIAGAIGTGGMWGGRETVPGVVLYVIAEGLHGVKPRVRAWEAVHGREMAGVHFLPLAVQAGLREAWRELCACAQRLGATLIVLDTQARITVGMEENSARDMGLFVDALEALRRATGATVLSVHHEGRSGETMRGSTALDGAATSIMRAVKEDDHVTVSSVKAKDAAPFLDLHFKMLISGTSVVPVFTGSGESGGPTGPSGRPWVRLWFARHRTDWVSVTELVSTGTVSKSNFHDSKYALEKVGLLAQTGDGNSRRYRLLRDPVSGRESGESGDGPVGPPDLRGVGSPVGSAPPYVVGGGPDSPPDPETGDS